MISDFPKVTSHAYGLAGDVNATRQRCTQAVSARRLAASADDKQKQTTIIPGRVFPMPRVMGGGGKGRRTTISRLP